ncbi:transcriptional regulator [Lacticaseibacillus paracasei]|nr:transcriptional regulator [Lacticaseibacillus paracasei]
MPPYKTHSPVPKPADRAFGRNSQRLTVTLKTTYISVSNRTAPRFAKTADRTSLLYF